MVKQNYEKKKIFVFIFENLQLPTHENFEIRVIIVIFSSALF